MRRFYILLLIIFFASVIKVLAADVSFSTLKPLQGETVLVKIMVKNLVPSAAFFDKETIPLFDYRNQMVALFGIAATKTPGQYIFEIKFNDGSSFQKNITVRRKSFPKLDLGIPEELGITPGELVVGLVKGNSELNEILSVRTSEVFFKKSFALPLANNRKLSSVFGEIRKTGDQEIRHLGIDLDARLGAAVGAINDGIVRRAYEDPIYGKTLIIDHGQGIFSLYLHLNKFFVSDGNRVSKGQLIGAVGKSGYSTAPHLHFSIKIANTSVNPLSFVSVFTDN